MGRLKKDHTGWRTNGLWKKYQSPAVIERTKPKSKKDTRKWCRGKVGVEHNYHAYQRERYSWELDDWIPSYIQIKCVNCGKQGYKKSSAIKNYPMHIFVKQVCETTPVQVRLSNGTYSTPETYHEAHYV